MQLHFEGVKDIEAEFAAAQTTEISHEEDPPFADADLEDISGWYLNGSGDFLVGERHGELVTMGGLQKETETSALVRRMRTRNDVRGRGYGNLLLASLERRATDLGYTELIVDPLATNTGARRFYERAGFREAEHKTLGRYDIIIYRKSL